jgi:hypothetical protein
MAVVATRNDPFRKRRGAGGLPVGRLLLVAVLTVGLVGATGGHVAAGAEGPSCSREIKPVLSNRCLRCHGPDAAARQGGGDGGLRLDTATGSRADLGGHAAVVPGDPAASALLSRITSSDPDLVMPPPGAGERLTDRDVDLLRRWIAAGADYEPHWSYVAPVRPPVPVVRDATWPANDIDRFVLARLEAEGLAPRPAADRAVLARRLALDLTGLPLPPEEVDAFVADAAPAAVERLVDRLLAHPGAGEHAARQWLDLARYADSGGYASDVPREIWGFRDWVIRACDDNMPFDEFTVRQLAGDLLPEATTADRIATAFHRNTLTNTEGGTIDEEFRTTAVVDRVNTTLATWMGTTIACAQCHDHKYDPLSQREFFGLYAIFNNTADADRADEAPLQEFFTPAQEARRAGLDEQLAEVERVLATDTPALAAARGAWDGAFPRDIAWTALVPESAAIVGGPAGTPGPDNTVSLPAAGATAVTTITARLPAGTLAALRLEFPADPALPGGGPGHGGGNFVLTGIGARLEPLAATTPRGRFVRVELPGPERILSLAEVEVVDGTGTGRGNLARGKPATQASTAFDGPAARAVDGNTSGVYTDASVTHTATQADPWWEVDLGEEQAVGAIKVWNRTDGSVGSRLTGARVLLLDAARQTAWQTVIGTAPAPLAEWAPDGGRELPFAVAFADRTQPGFTAASVLAPADEKAEREAGWAPGGTAPSALSLVLPMPIDMPAGMKLVVSLRQRSKHAGHTVGRVRLAATGDGRVGEWNGVPADVAAILVKPAAARTAAEADRLADHHRRHVAVETAAARQRQMALTSEKQGIKPAKVPVMVELAGDQRRVTKLQHRGNYLDTGAEVTEGGPAVFPPISPGAVGRIDRLALAKWLVDRANPLTARVVVNRIWERLFGIGLVATSEEFGSQGDPPSHPELLDWLAVELVERGWDTRAITRLVVTSAAYRQSSQAPADLVARDPDNRLLARGPRVRLSAEVIRDQALAAAGLLAAKKFGPSVNPPQPNVGLSAAFGGGIDWQTSTGEDRWRRALYTTWRRSNPYPSMATFDAPNREVCTVRRPRTNTPLQALVMLNDPVYVEAAQALARRMVRDAGPTAAERVTRGFRLVLARAPTAAEVERLVRLHDDALASFRADGAAATSLATSFQGGESPLGPLPPEADAAEVASLTVVANVLLNLDEAFMCP